MESFKVKMAIIGNRLRFLSIIFICISFTIIPMQFKNHAATVFAVIAIFLASTAVGEFLPYRRISEESLMKITRFFAFEDMILYSILINATGGITSPYFYNYFLCIVWLCAFFKPSEHTLFMMLYMVSYAAAVSLSKPNFIETFMLLLPRIGAMVLVGWISYRIAWEMEFQRKKIEKIIDGLPEGLFILDKYGRVSLVNSKSEEYFGSKVKAFLGSYVKTGEEGHDLQALREFVRRKCKLNITEESEGDNRAGEIAFGNKIYKIAVSPVRLEDEEEFETIVLVSDITGEKETEKIKRDYISMITHDLKNPILVIRCAGDSIAQFANDDPEISEMLGLIDYESKNLERMVSDMLDSSVIESGKLSLRKETSDIVQIASKVINSLRMPAAESEISIHLYNSENSRIPIEIDRERISRVFANLIQNSIKYTDCGGEISVLISRFNRELTIPENIREEIINEKIEDSIIVSIKDNGVGISKEYHKDIFRRYVRSGDRINLKTRGTGLGLAICKDIVEMHRGKIWLESEQGEGSTFSFIIPYEEIPDEVEPKNEDKPEITETEKPFIYPVFNLPDSMSEN